MPPAPPKKKSAPEPNSPPFNPPWPIPLSHFCARSNESGTGHQTPSRWPLAHRTGFGRAQSRRCDLPQRLAVLGGHFGHVASRLARGVARRHSPEQNVRGLFQLVFSLFG